MMMMMIQPTVSAPDPFTNARNVKSRSKHLKQIKKLLKRTYFKPFCKARLRKGIDGVSPQQQMWA
jgi:hypothetical protein